MTLRVKPVFLGFFDVVRLSRTRRLGETELQAARLAFSESLFLELRQRRWKFNRHSITWNESSRCTMEIQDGFFKKKRGRGKNYFHGDADLQSIKLCAFTNNVI